MSWRAWLNVAPGDDNLKVNSGSDKVIGGRVAKNVHPAKGKSTAERKNDLGELSDLLYRTNNFSSDDDSIGGDPLVPTARDLAEARQRYGHGKIVPLDAESDNGNENPLSSPEPSHPGLAFARSAIATGDFGQTPPAENGGEGDGGEDGGEDGDEDGYDEVEYQRSENELFVPNAEELLDAFDRTARGSAPIRPPSSEDVSSLSSPPTSLSSFELIDRQEVAHIAPWEDPGPGEFTRYEQVFLNTILGARDEYSFMPTSWRMHFRGVPLPDSLFYVQTQQRSLRPRIYAHSEKYEYRGARTLRKLMQLHERIREYRNRQATYPTPPRDYESTLGGRIRKELTDALRWADLDAKTAKYTADFPTNVMILEMSDADRLDMDWHIQRAMTERAELWRAIFEPIPEDDRPMVPVIFAFVIFKHIVSIVTLDGDDLYAICHIPIQLNLSEENHYQWNALAIMVTICWGRDLYEDLIEDMRKLKKWPALLEDSEPSDNEKESDPDA
ncbi:mitochondrial import receptor subunit tom20 [Hypoxylon texense]